MANLIRHVLRALLLLCFLSATSAFHYHKIMAAALLANSLQRKPLVPLPIPIPIPVKTGGNTIIALADGDDDHYNIQHISSCSRPPCGHKRRIDYFW